MVFFVVARAIDFRVGYMHSHSHKARITSRLPIRQRNRVSGFVFTISCFPLPAPSPPPTRETLAPPLSLSLGSCLPFAYRSQITIINKIIEWNSVCAVMKWWLKWAPILRTLHDTGHRTENRSERGQTANGRFWWSDTNLEIVRRARWHWQEHALSIFLCEFNSFPLCRMNISSITNGESLNRNRIDSFIEWHGERWIF